MIKNVILSLLFTLMATVTPYTSLAAEKVEIRFAYVPNSIYLVEQSADYDMTMKFQNPFVAAEELRAKFPVSFDVRDNRTISIETGNITDGKSFPITIELKKGDQIVSVNGSPSQKVNTSLEKLIGLRVHGTSDKGGKIKFDKIDGKEVSEEDRKLYFLVFEQLSKSLNQIESKPIGVGESFTQKVPFDFPVPGIANIGMEMTIVYKLVRIVDKIAEFDTTTSFKLAVSEGSEAASKIEATGDGTGSLVYDIDKKVALKNTSKFNMEMVVPTDDAKIIITAKSFDTSTTEMKAQGSTSGGTQSSLRSVGAP